jgi:hypothetical protein
MRESIIVLVQIADAHRISPGMVRVLATPRFEIITANAKFLSLKDTPDVLN